MSEPTYVPSEDEYVQARIAIFAQASRFKLGLPEQDVEGFLEHMADVYAHQVAAVRFYTEKLKPEKMQSILSGLSHGPF